MVDREQGGPRVVWVLTCDLKVSTGSWAYAVESAEDIERNWVRAKNENPALFNGTIYLMSSFEIAGSQLKGTFLKSDFKSYLFWRHQGFPEAAVWDAFGSGILCSREGHVILGRQAKGHVNAGKAYMPGGFLDSRDVRADGWVDVKASIIREMGEETGIDLEDTILEPGYYLTFLRSQISVGVMFRSRLSSAELSERVRRHIASEASPELVDVVVATPELDLDTIELAAFAKPLLKAVFSQQQRKN